MSLRVYLYDAGGHDREVELAPDIVGGLDEDSLLWIDVDKREEKELAQLAAILEIPENHFSEVQEGQEPRLDNYGTYFRFVVNGAPQHPENNGESAAEAGQGEVADHANALDLTSTPRIDFIVGKRWLVTIHDGPVICLARFREQDKAETQIGRLSPQALAASLLDWHLGVFFSEVSIIETAVDKLDERVLRETGSGGLLGRMVAMRRRVSKLRALLVRQREIFYGLSRPDFALITDAGAMPFYQALATRFERAVDEVERARDLVTGSFELFTSRSSQQTNDLVKVLTFLTAIIGFCAAVAGVFGMNFRLEAFDTGNRGFLAVTAGLLLVSAMAVVYARHRRWI